MTDLNQLILNDLFSTAPQTKRANTNGAAETLDTSFADALNDRIDNSINADNIPRYWELDGCKCGSDSVFAVDKFLLEYKIIASKRTPTHEITAEQREWLASRHDLEALKTASVDSKEFGQLLGDLYYQNIISKDEAMSPWVHIVEERSTYFDENGEEHMFFDFDTLDEYRSKTALEFLAKFIELRQESIEKMREEYYKQYLAGNPENYVRFIKQDHEYNVNTLKNLSDTLTMLFGSSDSRSEAAFSAINTRKIQDASQQFGEDFSTLL